MKVVTLNIWGGRVKGPLLDFLERQKETVDIFCFQEVYSQAKGKESEDYKGTPDLDIYTSLKTTLAGHESYFRPSHGGYYGQAMFVRRGIEVSDEGDIVIYHNTNPEPARGTHSRNMQYAVVTKDGQKYCVANVHGLWNGGGKTDTPERIAQSQNIAAFMNGRTEKKILCGDFNLLPTTESLRIVEEGMVNLVKVHNIQSTRTSFYTKPEKFADYVLVSPDVTVGDFKVLPDEVSDHAALLVEFS